MSCVAIFDLDGTLIDTPRGIVETFAATFARLNVSAHDAADIRATIGLPLEVAFGKLLGVACDDAMVWEAVKAYQEIFKEIILPKAQSLVFSGVAKGLADLRAQGVTLAVATSKFNASAEALLKAAKLRDEFSVVVGADQVANPKPHPEVGLKILSELGVRAKDAVMVGDTTHDLLMAKAAKMRSIAVTYGIHSVEQLHAAEPTWLADSFAEVVGLVEGAFFQPIHANGRN